MPRSVNLRSFLISALVLAGAAYGFSGSAWAAAEDPTGEISCTADGFPAFDSGNANTASQDDTVEITVHDISVGSQITFNVTTSSTSASIDVDNDTDVDGTYSPNQNLNNGHDYEVVFTATQAGTGTDASAVFTLTKRPPPGTWLTWSVSCGGGSVSQPSILATKEEISPGPYEAGDDIEFLVTVINNGNETLDNVNVSDPNADFVSCTETLPLNDFDPSASFTCTYTHTVTEGDIEAGSYENCATATGEPETSGGTVESEACVTVNFIQVPAEEETDEATREFLFRRMDRLLSDGPDRARLLRKCEDRGYAGEVRASGGSGKDFDAAFGTSLHEVRAYSANAAERKLKATDDDRQARRHWLGPSGGAGADLLPVYEEIAPVYAEPECNRFDVWVEGHYTAFDSDFGDGDFGVVYAGADYLVTDRFLIGLLVQFDWMSATETESGVEEWDIDGNGWMAGPYLSAEVVKNLFFDARFAWGQSDNDATVNVEGTPFSGGFDTDRWLASARLSGNFTRDDWRVTPEVQVAYMEEKRKTFDVSDGGGTTTTVDGTTLSLGRLTAGPEFAYRIRSGSMIIEPQFAMRFIWDFHADGDEVSGVSVYDDSPRGAVEVGLGIQAENGVAARFGAKYDGIGTGGGLEAWNFNAWLNIPFQ